MLKSMLSDLNDVDEYFVDYLLNKKITLSDYANCHCIYIENDLYQWLNDNCDRYDCCIFIAPEDDLIQYNITKLLEQHDISIIGSRSYASYICSSKYRTYQELSKHILKIPSIKIDVNNINYKNINDNYDLNNTIIKPDDRTSSDLIYNIESIDDLKKIMRIYKKESIEYALIQKYIDGTPISISALCNNNYINCISINSQEISHKNNQIKYLGCKTPINHPLQEEIIKISKNIIKQINGIRGFIGIDYIIKNNNIYFVEINSRITTPYIVLHNISNINLTKTLIELVLYNKENNIYLNKKGQFFK